MKKWRILFFLVPFIIFGMVLACFIGIIDALKSMGMILCFGFGLFFLVNLAEKWFDFCFKKIDEEDNK